MKATFHRGLLLVVILMTGLPSLVALCQGTERERGVYNSATETTVKGTVEHVRTAFLPGGGASAQSQGESSGPLYLDLNSDSGKFAVFLGPAWFAESKGFKFAKGDQVEVTGSKVREDAIVAREVKKDDKILTLRDAQGNPQWSGGR